MFTDPTEVMVMGAWRSQGRDGSDSRILDLAQGSLEMNINEITMNGNVVFDPRFSGGNGKKSRTLIRIAHTQRRRESDGTWVDGDTTFIDVICWGLLAENVVESVSKGSPVIVSGRLRSRTVETVETSLGADSNTANSGRTTTYFEIIASAVGPDLSRGATQFRSAKSAGAARQEERALQEVADVMERDAQVA
jgi:single-strand DNA-binding protein